MRNAQPESIASAHESLVELLRAIDPRVLIRMACEHGGIAMAEIAEVFERTPKLEVAGLSKAAKSYAPDLVFTAHTKNGRVIEIWVFEAQLSEALLKQWRWGLYVAAYAAEYNRKALLAVFSPEPELRAWLRTKLIPKIQPPPLLIEPDQVERITDYSDARQRPELAVLSCIYHAHEPAPFADRVAVVRAALVAIGTLAGREAQRYTVLVMSLAPPAAVNQALEELRESGEIDERRYEEFSDSERKGHSFHRGREEGREEGREQGREQGREEGRERQRELLRRMIVDLLELRGFDVTPATQAQLEACTSLETLERWYAAVKTAAANHPVELLLE